jgi:hypothetical protein
MVRFFPDMGVGKVLGAYPGQDERPFLFCSIFFRSTKQVSKIKKHKKT